MDHWLAIMCLVNFIEGFQSMVGNFKKSNMWKRGLQQEIVEITPQKEKYIYGKVGFY